MCIRDRANSIHEKNSYKVTYIGNSLLPFEQHSENQSFLGYQRHLCDYRSLKYVEEFCPDSLSLGQMKSCLLYTSDAADERSSVDLGGRRIIKKKNNKK